MLNEIKAVLTVSKSAWKLVPVKHRWALGFASSLIAVISASNIVVALLLGVLVDRIREKLDTNGSEELIRAVFVIFGAMAGIYVVREALNVLRRVVVEQSCTHLNCNMQREVVHQVMKFDMETLVAEKLGTLHGKIFRSVDGLIHFVRLMFLDCLPAVFTGLFAILAAVYRQPLLGLIMAGVVPISFWLTLKQLNSQKGVRLELLKDCEAIDGIVVEQLGGLEYIRVAHTHQAESKRLGEAMERRRRRELSHHIQMAFYGCAKALNEGTFHIVLLAFATYLAIIGRISVGDVLTFSVLFLNVMAPLNEVHRVIDEGQESSLRLADLIEMLETPIDPSFSVSKSESNTSLVTQTIAASPLIELKNVRVVYRLGHNEFRPALNNVSLKIEKGETIGVAGHSGSGKSTWIKLLLRLLHSDHGQVTFLGKNLLDISREELAQNIGYVGQNPFVFSGSFANNIAYGCGETSIEKIMDAAKLANLHDDIIDILGGYDAVISERGGNLSGGQKQRIAIARILLKCPPIMILDEATSALDNSSERHIQASLGLGTGQRTTILIAHRLSTLRSCDRIFVFEHGSIAESGSYHDLVEQNGIFNSLVNAAQSNASESPKT